MTWTALHLSRSIAAAPAEVIAVAGDPRRLPEWAAGLSAGIRRDGDRWVTDAPMGEVEVRFLGPVAAGVLDHEVVLTDGTVVYNPLRVLPNDAGSEVVFTLFHRDGVDAAEFEADAQHIRDDLERLAGLLGS